MRSSDWSSDVCSSDLADDLHGAAVELDGEVDGAALAEQLADFSVALAERHRRHGLRFLAFLGDRRAGHVGVLVAILVGAGRDGGRGHGGDEDRRKAACVVRSEEHTSELQSLMRTSYAVFCLKKKI